MKKLLLAFVCFGLLFSCSENNSKNANSGKSTGTEEKELANKEESKKRVDLRGLYDVTSDCGVYQSIKIREVGESGHSYIVEFGHRNGNHFETIEGRYAYFSVNDYPNIEFSCPTGRIQKTIMGSNILEVYKLKVVKDGTKIYLNGNVYEAELGLEKPKLNSYQKEQQNIFIKTRNANDASGLIFYQTLPIKTKTLSFNRDRIIFNGMDFEYGKTYIKEKVAKTIGEYEEYEEGMDAYIIKYPELELHFDYDMKFERIAKDLEDEKPLKAFGFEFSYKTTEEDLTAFMEKNNYKRGEDKSVFDIVIDENIVIRCCFDDSNTHLERVLIGKKIEQFYMPPQ